MKDGLGRPEVVKKGLALAVLREWAELMGPTIAEHAVPDRFENGTLWLAATGSAWAQEIRFQKDRILEKLNESAGQKVFLALRIGTRRPSGRVGRPIDELLGE